MAEVNISIDIAYSLFFLIFFLSGYCGQQV